MRAGRQCSWRSACRWAGQVQTQAGTSAQHQHPPAAGSRAAGRSTRAAHRSRERRRSRRWGSRQGPAAAAASTGGGCGQRQLWSESLPTKRKSADQARRATRLRCLIARGAAPATCHASPATHPCSAPNSRSRTCRTCPGCRQARQWPWGSPAGRAGCRAQRRQQPWFKRGKPPRIGRHSGGGEQHVADAHRRRVVGRRRVRLRRWRRVAGHGAGLYEGGLWRSQELGQQRTGREGPRRAGGGGSGSWARAQGFPARCCALPCAGRTARTRPARGQGERRTRARSQVPVPSAGSRGPAASCFPTCGSPAAAAAAAAAGSGAAASCARRGEGAARGGTWACQRAWAAIRPIGNVSAAGREARLEDPMCALTWAAGRSLQVAGRPCRALIRRPVNSSSLEAGHKPLLEPCLRRARRLQRPEPLARPPRPAHMQSLAPALASSSAGASRLLVQPARRSRGRRPAPPPQVRVRAPAGSVLMLCVARVV